MNKQIDECLLLRDKSTDDFTLGQFYFTNKPLGYTCEDRDRFLERDGVKVPKQTAIPRGYYRLTVTFSNRFQKELPLVVDVPQFVGVRIHGGNTSEDTEGCPLLGLKRTADGVQDCKRPVAELTRLIKESEAAGREVWLVVR